MAAWDEQSRWDGFKPARDTVVAALAAPTHPGAVPRGGDGAPRQCVPFQKKTPTPDEDVAQNCPFLGYRLWGDALGWYGAAPLGLKAFDVGC